MPTITPVPGSSTRTVGEMSALLAGEKLSVKSGFYAIGDGVANDAGAIGTALTSLSGLGGGKLYFPRATYLVNSKMSVPSGTTLHGESSTSLIKRGADMATGKGIIDIAGTESDIIIAHLVIDGNVTTPAQVAYSSPLFTPYDAQFVKNSSIWIHGGAKRITIRHLTIRHTGGYAIYIDATAGNIEDITIDDVTIEDCRPFTFLAGTSWSAPDQAYGQVGSWIGGIHAEGDGDHYGVKNLTIRNCKLRRVAGNAIWVHSNWANGSLPPSVVHENVSITDNWLEDTALDGIEVGAVSGGIIARNHGRRSGYLSLTDGAVGTPRWLPSGLNGACFLDHSGWIAGMSVQDNDCTSPNGSFINTDGFGQGGVSNNTSRVPLSGDPEYTTDQIASGFGPGGAGNYSSGIVSSNSNNLAVPGDGVSIDGNKLFNFGGVAIGAFALRNSRIINNIIEHSATAVNIPIVLGNIGTGSYQRSYGNVVEGNRISWSPSVSQAAIQEVNEGSAFQAGDKNWIVGNSCSGNCTEFSKDASTNSSLGLTLSGTDDRQFYGARVSSAPAPTAGGTTVAHYVGAPGSHTRLLLDAFGTNFTGALDFRAARGTAAAPTTTQAGDVIAAPMRVFAYGASGYSPTSRANISVYATETWTDAHQGTQIEIKTTPAGTIVPEKSMLIDATGVSLLNARPLLWMDVGGVYHATLQVVTDTFGHDQVYLDNYNYDIYLRPRMSSSGGYVNVVGTLGSYGSGSAAFLDGGGSGGTPYVYLGRASNTGYAGVAFQNSASFNTSKQWTVDLRAGDSDLHFRDASSSTERVIFSQSTGDVKLLTGSLLFQTFGSFIKFVDYGGNLRNVMSMAADPSHNTDLYIDNTANQDIYLRPASGRYVNATQNMTVWSSLGVGLGMGGIPATTLDVGGTISITPTSGSYNEGIRAHPSTANDYSTLVLGAVAGTSGTGVGQWSIIRYPAANSNMLGIRHNNTDCLQILTSGNISFGPGSYMGWNESSQVLSITGKTGTAGLNVLTSYVYAAEGFSSPSTSWQAVNIYGEGGGIYADNATLRTCLTLYAPGIAPGVGPAYPSGSNPPNIRLYFDATGGGHMSVNGGAYATWPAIGSVSSINSSTGAFILAGSSSVTITPSGSNPTTLTFTASSGGSSFWAAGASGIHYAGPVGIGILTPYSPLAVAHVANGSSGQTACTVGSALFIEGSGWTFAEIASAAGSGAGLLISPNGVLNNSSILGLSDSGDWGLSIQANPYASANTFIRFRLGTAEKMRLAYGGQFLVGASVADGSTGLLQVNGDISLKGSTPGSLLLSTGYVKFYYGSAWSNALGMNGSPDLYLDNVVNRDIYVRPAINQNVIVGPDGTHSGGLIPNGNNLVSLGTYSYRWSSLWTYSLDTAGVATIYGISSAAGLTLSHGWMSSAEGYQTASTTTTAVNAPLGGATLLSAILGDGLHILGVGTPVAGVAGYGKLSVGTDGKLYFGYGTATPTPVGGNPGGSNTQVQFNNSSAFGGSANFAWNNGDQVLTVTGKTGTAGVNVLTSYIYAKEGFASDGTLYNTINLYGTGGGISADNATLRTCLTMNKQATDPAASAANTARICFDSNGRLRESFNTGAYISQNWLTPSNLVAGSTGSASANTAAINAAIAAIAATGGGCVRIPDGTFYINGALILSGYSNVRIAGDSRAGTIIWQLTAATNIFTANGGSLDTQGYWNSVETMTLKGPYTVGTSGSGWAIDAEFQWHLLIRDVASTCMANGFKIFQSLAFVEDCDIRLFCSGCDAILVDAHPYHDGGESRYDTLGGAGIYLDRVIIDGSSTNSRAGIEVKAGGGVQIRHCDITGVAPGGMDYSILVDPQAGQTVNTLFISNCWIDQANVYSLFINPSGSGSGTGQMGVVSNMNVSDCRIAGGPTAYGVVVSCGTSGAHYGYVDGLVFDNCKIQYNGYHGLSLLGGYNAEADAFINTDVLNCQITDNSYGGSTPRDYSQIVVYGVSKWNVRNCTLGKGGSQLGNGSNPDVFWGQHGIYINQACNNFAIENNTFTIEPYTGTVTISGDGITVTATNQNLPWTSAMVGRDIIVGGSVATIAGFIAPGSYGGGIWSGGQVTVSWTTPSPGAGSGYDFFYDPSIHDNSGSLYKSIRNNSRWDQQTTPHVNITSASTLTLPRWGRDFYYIYGGTVGGGPYVDNITTQLGWQDELSLYNGTFTNTVFSTTGNVQLVQYTFGGFKLGIAQLFKMRWMIHPVYAPTGKYVLG